MSRRRGDFPWISHKVEPQPDCECVRVLLTVSVLTLVAVVVLTQGTDPSSSLISVTKCEHFSQYFCYLCQRKERQQWCPWDISDVPESTHTGDLVSILYYCRNCSDSQLSRFYWLVPHPLCSASHPWQKRCVFRPKQRTDSQELLLIFLSHAFLREEITGWRQTGGVPWNQIFNLTWSQLRQQTTGLRVCGGGGGGRCSGNKTWGSAEAHSESWWDRNLFTWASHRPQNQNIPWVTAHYPSSSEAADYKDETVKRSREEAELQSWETYHDDLLLGNHWKMHSNWWNNGWLPGSSPLNTHTQFTIQ